MFEDPNDYYSSEEFVEEAALEDGIDPDTIEPTGEPEEETVTVAGPGAMVELQDDSVQGFFDHKEAVFCVAISPADSNVVACGGAEDKGFLFNAADGERLAELGGHEDSVSAVAWNHDGSLCATGGLDGRVQVWDARGTRVQTLEGPGGGVNFLRWHPRGNALLAGSEDCSSWLWLAEQNKTVAVFFGHAGPVECGDMTADGKICVTGSEDCSVRVWRPKDGSCLHALQGHAFHRAPVVKLAVGRGTAVLSGDVDGGLFLSSIEGHVKVSQPSLLTFFSTCAQGAAGRALGQHRVCGLFVVAAAGRVRIDGQEPAGVGSGHHVAAADAGAGGRGAARAVAPHAAAHLGRLRGSQDSHVGSAAAGAGARVVGPHVHHQRSGRLARLDPFCDCRGRGASAGV